MKEQQKKKAKRCGSFALQRLADLCHDMRTPLSIILNTAQLLEEQPGENQERDLAQIRRNAQQLLRLVGNIGDLAAIDEGRVRLHMERVEGVVWLREMGLACAPYARHKGLEFLVVANLKEVWIQCDLVRLERCVLNLFSNAVRFTEPGGLVCLSIEQVGQEAHISVCDNGCGINKEQAKSLFHRFSAGHGSGLGLSLVKSFIERMGGRIEIESEVGEGTRASLLLPIDTKEAHSASTMEALGSSVAGELADLLVSWE
ncbi:MAG: HAMP domain-containing histidine kinase [Clostridia bacterium]|nr:HAMP domain-containing histidine kinase [Clostridia bacterium]